MLLEKTEKRLLLLDVLRRNSTLLRWTAHFNDHNNGDNADFAQADEWFHLIGIR